MFIRSAPHASPCYWVTRLPEITGFWLVQSEGEGLRGPGEQGWGFLPFEPTRMTSSIEVCENARPVGGSFGFFEPQVSGLCQYTDILSNG